MKFEDELRNKIKEMIEESSKARKDYGYIDLCHRIETICLDYGIMSYPKLVDNLQKLGFRIFRLKMELGETECDRLVEKAIDELLEKWGKYDNFRETSIQNIDWLLELYREQHQQLEI